MSATGIGASVRRKEDFRFITGQGQYTDDVVRPGETRAVFVRSPHAHAKIKSIDVSAAQEDARRGRGAHRRGSGRRQDRQSHLRLDDPFQGRHADEDGAASGAGDRQGQPCRRRGRGGDRGDAGAGRATPPRRSRSITRCCRRSRIQRRRSRGRRSTKSRRRTPSTNGTSATPRRRRRPLPRPSTSPSSTSSTTAWCRTRSSRAPRSPNTTPAPTI